MSTRWLHSQRAIMALFVVALLAVGLLTILVVRQQATPPDGQVYLESGGSIGPNPFVPLPRSEQNLADGNKPITGKDGRTDLPVQAATVANDRATCDSGKLISYLGAHAQAASAWVKSLNSDPTLSWSGGNKVAVQQISFYIHELTPRLLDGDLRVTNYQFVNGAAHPVQSILEKGTTVLVDTKGVVRVRCACGNPLTPMVRLNAVPVYRGAPWSGFHPQKVIVTQSGPRCGSDEFSGGAHCWRLAACPRDELRGDDGRCYAPPARCSGRQVRSDGGWCYYPHEVAPPHRDGWRDEDRHPGADARPDRPDQPEPDQPKEPRRPEKPGRPEGTEGPTGPDQQQAPVQPQRPGQPDESARSDKSEQPEGTGRSAEPSRQDRPHDPAMAGNPGRHGQPDSSPRSHAGKSGQPGSPGDAGSANRRQRPEQSHEPEQSPEKEPPSKSGPHDAATPRSEATRRSEPEQQHESALPHQRSSGQSDEVPDPNGHGRSDASRQPDSPRKPGRPAVPSEGRG